MAAAATVPIVSDTGWFGHPRGLSTLFFTELWERFSYYGMRGFLILYMVKALSFTDQHAGAVYGNYVSSVWLAAILGGVVADRWLGQYRSVFVGGVIIALGHFTLAFHPLPFFYAGLSLIVVGTGLLKPNASTLVGGLYEQEDERRDAGFSIFYMGINVGALLGPIVAGKIAEGIDWHLGFACAGVGMSLGLIQYIAGRRRLQPALDRLAARPKPAVAAAPQASSAFTREDWKRIAAVVVFFLFASLFWGAFEQAGSTLTLFADRYVRLELLGLKLYASWFVSVQAAFVILLSPVFAWAWVRQTRPAPAVVAREVRACADVRRPGLRPAHAGGGSRARRAEGQPVVARGCVFHRRARRGVPLPCGALGRDEARAGADRRSHDGCVLPLERPRQQTGWLVGGLHQHDAAPDIVRRHRGGDIGRRAGDGPAASAGAKPDGGGALTAAAGKGKRET